MTKAGEQNDLDLRAIVEEINAAFASSSALSTCLETLPTMTVAPLTPWSASHWIS
jgi:hypothetical protein